MLKPVLLILFSMGLMSSSGCVISRPVIPESGHYYINPYIDFSTIPRVVVLEFDNRTTRPEVSGAFTDAVTESLQKKHIFSLKILRRTDPAWRNLDLEDTWSYTLKELSAIRRELQADAVLFGAITQYRPYPHMLAGLALKMVDLRDGNLLWAIEQVWDSTDRRVEQRMKVTFNSRMRSGYQPMNWQLFITSPRAFNKFISIEVAETFPEGNYYVRAYGRSGNGGKFGFKTRFLKKTLEIPEKTLKFVGELTTIEP